MSFVSHGGKFKLYTVLNGLIFPTPTQSRISFERPVVIFLMINQSGLNAVSPWPDNHHNNNDNETPMEIVLLLGRETTFDVPNQKSGA
jgi:hypothetical protein